MATQIAQVEAPLPRWIRLAVAVPGKRLDLTREGESSTGWCAKTAHEVA